MRETVCIAVRHDTTPLDCLHNRMGIGRAVGHYDHMPQK